MKDAAACARRLGARPGGILRQTDTYFSVPAGRLKLREEGTRGELIWYNRPDIRNNRYSEFTIVRVEDAGRIKSLFSRLFGKRVVVKKQRRLFRMTDVRIHLDTVAGLGSFIEFEVLVTGSPAEAERRMRLLRQAFHIKKNALIAGSYSDLLLRQGKGAK